MGVTTRHLRAVPPPNPAKQRERFDSYLRLISDSMEELHDLAACTRTLKRYIERANECGATQRASYLEAALRAIQEGVNAK